MPNVQRRPSRDDAKWAERAAGLQFVALSRVREVADKWRGGLTAMTALVATATVGTAPFVGDRIDHDIKVALAIVVAVALLLLCVATWQAMRASFGVPDKIAANGEALRAWHIEEIGKAKSQLACAQRATVLAVLALTVAAGIGLFGSTNSSDKKPAPVTGTVTTNTGDVFCGVVAAKKDKVTITGLDAAVHDIALADVKTLETPSSC